ncbi:unnamed protein product [Clonostachys rhizophaga]|uniref:Proteasome inhibitor PI31 subunit n=1 Tax=Clonostachys rhizophaga TaxID=160324 RepID=A0A9N9YDR3_9HYPO|nr:unnamed protein product [Clonostachys rhizophaga]
MTSNAAIVQGMADALPTHQKDDDSSDLASSYEAVALLVHAHLASLGFRLFGFDEEKPLPEAESLAPRLPPQWNNGFGSLSFAYKHKMSSMDLLLRIDRMGTKVSVRGFAIGHDKIHGFERPIRDIVNSKGLPVKITMTDNGEDRSDLPEQLKKVFASEDAIKCTSRALPALPYQSLTNSATAVLDAVMTEIIQKLYPSLDENDRSTDRAEANERLREERRPPNVDPFSDPSQPSVPYPRPGLLPEAARPRPPAPVGDFPPPGFEDEHEINRPGRGLVMPGGVSPFNIGRDDLNPPGLGPHDPLRGSFVGGGGLPRPGGSSGMHPTFDDPLFGGSRGGLRGDPDQGSYDPQVPPGARWDPVSPNHPRFPGSGGGGHNPFGGFGGPGGGGII